MRKQKFIAVVLLLVTCIFLFTGCVKKMPVPEVKEGRFDFSITYEVNGEQKTYTGVYVCEFKGTHVSLVGYGRDWTGYVENSDSSLAIPVQTNDDGIIYIGLGLSPRYLMSDPDFVTYEFDIPEPTLYMEYHSDDPNTSMVDGSLDFMAEYGVRLISYDYPEPIENDYPEKWNWSRFELSIN